MTLHILYSVLIELGEQTCLLYKHSLHICHMLLIKDMILYVTSDICTPVTNDTHDI